MRIYFIKDGKAVADRQVACDQPKEAAALARAMFEEGASFYDGVEVWSRLGGSTSGGRIARPRVKTPCGTRRPTMH